MKGNKSLFSKIKRRLFRCLYLYTGVNISVKGTSCFSYFRLRKQLRQFKKQGRAASASFPVTGLYPCYEDKSSDAGRLGFHYFYQDLHVAQRIHQNSPKRHVDIGSSIGGFIAHVASFRAVEVFDIRPLNAPIPNVTFKQFDLMQLHKENVESTDSISCLHALEHFGLGRYGNPICYEGHLLGFLNIHKILQANGKLYFSVPLGKQRVEFHAHRVFSLKYLLELITPLYHIDAFSYVDDSNVFFENVPISEEIICQQLRMPLRMRHF